MNIAQKKVCVVGLGYIGLPTACILATSCYGVLGMDIDDKVLSRIETGDLIDPEPDLRNLLIKALHTNNLKTSPHVDLADIYIITVPTPLDKNNQADISYVNTAADTISPYLRSNNLVLIESTCPIGTTEIVAHKLRTFCPNIHIAYCPERVMPGNIVHELIYNDRVVGGIDEASTLHAVTFYRSFVKGNILATNVRTAEAVKLAENAYRDINIAYANELSMISDRLGLDANEVISLANKHPRVQILNPSPGVGGHCIAVDPWFLVSAAPDLASLTITARKVNLKKADWVIQKIKEAIKRNSADTIACLGLTYKPDTSDIRESPALAIVQALEKETRVIRVDPYIPNTEPLYKALSSANIIVGLVAHKTFRDIPKSLLVGKTILDFAGVFK